jgi:hypothetical protein
VRLELQNETKIKIGNVIHAMIAHGAVCPECSVYIETGDGNLCLKGQHIIAKFGVQQKWIQAEGTYKEHFDICLSKKALAIKTGAIEIDDKQVCELLERKQARQF